ncbi:MAG TPA: lysophospholipase [Ruminococcaceae bacterium]|nr:lysophospholipase [Oscillospiraceae bacterium]
MKTFLFQGDSITDADRFRDEIGKGSRGYATFVEGKLGCLYPGEIEFYNMGVSGNRVVDMYARIKRDFLNIKPDYATVLIGVNDVWHELSDTDDPNGVSDPKYFRIYCDFIAEILEELPDCKIMILEPFVLCGSGTQAYYDVFRSEVEKRAASAKRVAEKFNLPFIPLQAKFDELTKLAPSSFWLADGVHPTAAGHEMIANAVVERFNEIR